MQSRYKFLSSCLGAKAEESPAICERFAVEPSGQSVKNVACLESFTSIPQRIDSSTTQGTLYTSACKVIKSCTHLRRKPSSQQPLEDFLAEITPIHPTSAPCPAAGDEQTPTLQSLLALIQDLLERKQAVDAEVEQLRVDNAALRSANTVINAKLAAACEALEEEQVLVQRAAAQMAHLKYYREQARLGAGCAKFYLECRAAQESKHQRELDKARLSTAVAVSKVLDLERQLAELRPAGVAAQPCVAAAAPCIAAAADGGPRYLDAHTGLPCTHEEADMRLRRPCGKEKLPAARRRAGLRCVAGPGACHAAAQQQQQAKPRGQGRHAGRPLSVVWEEQAEGVQAVPAVLPAGEGSLVSQAGLRSPAGSVVSVTYVTAAAGEGAGQEAVSCADSCSTPATATPMAFCSGAGHSAFQDIAFLPFD